MAGTFEYRLWQLRILLWIAVWTALSVFISLWSMVGGFALIGVGIALFHYLRSGQRGPFANRPSPASEQPRPQTRAERERDARYMVTQVLRSLTQAQVAYLCQDFSGDREAVAWLKKALPKGYRDTVEDLHQQLEQARQGREIPPGTRLAVRIVRRRDEVLAAIDALDRAHKEHPDHVMANPVIFVITEHLSAENEEPEVMTLAGWNPDKPALLPKVDLLNVFSERGAERQIRGQARLAAVRKALGQGMATINKDPRIFAVPAQAQDLVTLGVRLESVPLGFVIGTAELV